MRDKVWLETKYNEIRKHERSSYIFINMKIKRLRVINFLHGRAFGDRVIEAAYEAVENFLEEGEYVAKVSSCSFDILMKIKEEIGEQDLIRRFNALDECMEMAGNGNYKGVIFCGFGLFFMKEFDVDFDTAEYYAEVSRSQSLENPHMCSHMDVYGHSFIDRNLNFESLRKKFNIAMKNGDLQIYLQPKVNLKTGEVVHAEALIRWIDEKQGMIPLSDFLIPIEEHGLINLIDKLAFENACQCTKKWLDTYQKEIKISVNISKPTFNYQLFFEEYREIYEKYQSPKNCLEVEFLESIILNQVDRVRDVVNEIKDFGISCALDDFGSGFSSFCVLTECNIDILKIDRTLFMDYHNEKERGIVRHIIELAHELGMIVVAEGIEDKKYVQFLSDLNCDYIQGFIFYKPMPIAEFEERFVKGSEKINISDYIEG